MSSAKESNTLVILKEVDENYPNNYQDDLNKYRKDFNLKGSGYNGQDCFKRGVKASTSSLLEEREEELVSLAEKLPKTFSNKFKIQSNDDFKDRACGEPITTQHLKIDFTPIGGEDDYVFKQEKCLDFWKLIEQHPEIKKFKVYPETNVVKTTSSGNNEPVKDTSTLALKYLKKDGDKIGDTLSIKYQKFCELERGEYCFGQERGEKRTGGGKKKEVCKGTDPSTLDKGYSPASADGRRTTAVETKPISSEDAKVLCKQLEEWDTVHPKSMEQPGHSPALTHTVMQRKNIT